MMAKVRRVSMAAAMVGSAFTSGNLTGARASAAGGGADPSTALGMTQTTEGALVALPPPPAVSDGSARHRIVAVGELPDVLPVVLDVLSDLGGALSGQGAGVGDRATRAHVVAHDVLARRISLHVVEVDLLHAELADAVAPVVWFVPF